MRNICLTGLALVLIVPAVAQSAITGNTVDDSGALSAEGRRGAIGVLLACDTVQLARVRVTVTQRSGALAQGTRNVRCTTERKRFAVNAKLRSKTRLEAGEATVCVLARTADDARQWCKDITLE